jgi:hypothetical protein
MSAAFLSKNAAKFERPALHKTAADRGMEVPT